MKYIHFIGIGGIGTSSVAKILHHKGNKISGSDCTSSQITKNLKLSGIKVSIGHNEKNISKKHQLVIYSPAIPPSNPELKKAKKLKIKTISYPEALGQLSKDYFTIAVSGTHGKSTTTAMTALVAENGGLDPTVVIGTKIKQFKNRNFKVGKSKYLILEACEYKKSFLHIRPDILIITNIEAEHLDYYKNLQNYKKAFELLAKKVPKNGKIIIDSNDKNSKSVTKTAKAEIISISELNKKTEQKAKKQIELKPKVPGKFNIINASFAATIGTLLGIENKKIEQAIKSFSGTWRRMETKRKKLGKCKFIDDYAHHPTEIEMTLTAIREQNPKVKILCIFQPHQYSRTKILLKEFGKSFTNTDKVIIPNIYKVRDTKEDIKKVSPEDLVKEINKAVPNKAKNGNGLEKTAQYIKKNHANFDIIVTMGAGDIDKIYKLF